MAGGEPRKIGVFLAELAVQFTCFLLQFGSVVAEGGEKNVSGADDFGDNKAAFRSRGPIVFEPLSGDLIGDLWRFGEVTFEPVGLDGQPTELCSAFFRVEILGLGACFELFRGF